MLASVVLLFATHFAQIYARPSSDLWDLPNNDPAPSPELGPPGAVHADRDRSHLKFDVIGIAGAYLLWLLGTFLLIVFIAHPLRKKTRAFQASQPMVAMAPHPKTLPKPALQSPDLSLKSPKSPNKFTSIRSWGRKEHKASNSEYSISTVASFDEAHRAKNQNELADLYAAVMAHHEEKEVRSNVYSVDSQSEDFYTPLSPRLGETEHLYHSNQLSHPLAPTPVDDHFPEDVYDMEGQVSRTNTVKSNRSTTLSVISEFSNQVTSVMSPKKRPGRISVKDQRISQPMGSADLQDSNVYSDNVPLSPRIYTPGPPPLTPNQIKRHQQQQQEVPPVPELHQNFSQLHIQNQPSQSRDRRIPPALSLQHTATVAAGAQTAKAPKTLAFREIYGDSSMRSAPPTKTTFLDRPSKSNGPRTGMMPSTPYSPYMPNTPMTPITPRRLMTRNDLKQQKKEAKMRPLTEDDLVVDDTEMWGKVR